MSILDELGKSEANSVKTTVDNLSMPEDFDCDISITLQLFNSAAFKDCKSDEDASHITESNRNVKKSCCKDNYTNELMVHYKVDRLLLFKLLPKRNKKNLLKLVDSISQCITINGDSDSFAIVKVFDGNFISNKPTCIYDDFVTPGNTIDISKIYDVLKIITNKMTKI